MGNISFTMYPQLLNILQGSEFFMTGGTKVETDEHL